MKQRIFSEPELLALATVNPKAKLWIWAPSIGAYARLTKVSLDNACYADKGLRLRGAVKGSDYYFNGLDEPFPKWLKVKPAKAGEP